MVKAQRNGKCKLAFTMKEAESEKNNYTSTHNTVDKIAANNNGSDTRNP